MRALSIYYQYLNSIFFFFFFHISPALPSFPFPQERREAAPESPMLGGQVGFYDYCQDYRLVVTPVTGLAG